MFLYAWHEHLLPSNRLELPVKILVRRTCRFANVNVNKVKNPVNIVLRNMYNVEILHNLHSNKDCVYFKYSKRLTTGGKRGRGRPKEI